jgi:hypothetical protein
VLDCIPSRIIEKFFRAVTRERPGLPRSDDGCFSALLWRATPGNKAGSFVAGPHIFRKIHEGRVTSCEASGLRKKLQQPKKSLESGPRDAGKPYLFGRGGL